MILFIGLIDDIRDLKPNVRLTGHSLVALAMAVVAENQLSSFENILYFGSVNMGILTITVAIFATVGVINAVNMSDGVDGLSGASW